MQDLSQVVFGEGYEVIQALPPQCTDEPLAQGIRLRTLRWGFEDLEPQMADALVELLGENAVPVMQQKLVAMIGRNRFPKLLQCPVCCGMGCHIDVADTPCRMLHQHKHVKQAKSGRNDHTEVTGDDRLGMIPHKGHPALRRYALPWFPVPRGRHLLEFITIWAILCLLR